MSAPEAVPIASAERRKPALVADDQPGDRMLQGDVECETALAVDRFDTVSARQAAVLYH
jgi:hypothetical protein